MVQQHGIQLLQKFSSHLQRVLLSRSQTSAATSKLHQYSQGNTVTVRKAAGSGDNNTL